MAEVTINRKLNLVIPIETDNHGKIWIHSVPLSREVFASNYMLLTRTLANLYNFGIGPAMAPRIAMLRLKDTAKDMDEEKDISENLVQEIYRLTNVLMPNPDGGGWRTIPFSEVKMKKLVDEDSLLEVENAIVYFIVASSVHLKSELPMAFQGLKAIWNAETTLLNVTQYGNSLMTSTQEESTGEKPVPVANVGAPTPPRVVQRLSSIPS
jgi:hypothetical protein